MNKCYEVLDGTNTVTFTVTGKRSELENLMTPISLRWQI